MKYIHITTLFIISAIFLLSSTCKSSSPYNRQQEYSSFDSIWIPFVKAMESNDIEFLIANSLDSLTCFDCDIDTDIDSQKEYFDSEFLLKNHLDKLMHLPTLSDKPFSTYQLQDDLLRIGYTIETTQAPEGAYSLFFTLVKKDKKYYFQGMIVQ